MYTRFRWFSLLRQSNSCMQNSAEDVTALDPCPYTFAALNFYLLFCFSMKLLNVAQQYDEKAC
jgi:hypothetical protein